MINAKLNEIEARARLSSKSCGPCENCDDKCLAGESLVLVKALRVAVAYLEYAHEVKILQGINQILDAKE